MSDEQDVVIAGTELKLTVRVEDGKFTIKWDKMSRVFFFHDGYAALLRPGRGECEGMVELVRVPVNVEGDTSGYVEPLLSLAPTEAS